MTDDGVLMLCHNTVSQFFQFVSLSYFISSWSVLFSHFHSLSLCSPCFVTASVFSLSVLFVRALYLSSSHRIAILKECDRKVSKTFFFSLML